MCIKPTHIECDFIKYAINNLKVSLWKDESQYDDIKIDETLIEKHFYFPINVKMNDLLCACVLWISSFTLKIISYES